MIPLGSFVKIEYLDKGKVQTIKGRFVGQHNQYMVIRPTDERLPYELSSLSWEAYKTMTGGGSK